MKPIASRGTEAVGKERPRGLLFGMAASIDILEKPIKRIYQTCELAGAVDKFGRASELKTRLGEKIATGETSETRLAYDGICALSAPEPSSRPMAKQGIGTTALDAAFCTGNEEPDGHDGRCDGPAHKRAGASARRRAVCELAAQTVVRSASERQRIMLFGRRWRGRVRSRLGFE